MNWLQRIYQELHVTSIHLENTLGSAIVLLHGLFQLFDGVPHGKPLAPA